MKILRSSRAHLWKQRHSQEKTYFTKWKKILISTTKLTADRIRIKPAQKMFTPPANRIKGDSVNFMATCLCDAIFDDAAISAAKILRKFAKKVEFPQEQTCCGQPAFNSGDFESARKVIRHTMKAFSHNDWPIIVPSASCAAMLFHSSKIAFRESPQSEQEAVEKFSLRVWEFCDYLVNALGVKEIGGKYKAKAAVHNSCHGRGTRTPESLKKLLTSIEGLEIVEFESQDECCGFGGTFSVVFPQISSEMGEAKVRAVAAAKPDIVVAADTSCLLHQRGIAQKLGINYPAKHAAQVFYEAMKNGGIA